MIAPFDFASLDDDAEEEVGPAKLGLHPAYLAGLVHNVSWGSTGSDGESASAQNSANTPIAAAPNHALPPIPDYPPFVGLPNIRAIMWLMTLFQWVAWRYIAKPGKLKADKVPYNPSTGRKASSSDPLTWGTYAQAAALAERENMPGVGFVLSADDDLTGIDLDDCRDLATGVLKPWAADVLALAETYAELSPSGTGVRMFAQGKVAKATAFKPAGVEIYGKGRYLTVTGNHVEGTPLTINPAPKTLTVLLRRVEASKAEAQAAKAAASGVPAAPVRPSAVGRESFFPAVNALALANLAAWVTGLLPAARPSGTGYRVSSADLRRDLEEDLSITPEGIVDFGVADQGDPRDGKRSAIDLVMEHGAARGLSDRKGAALWLCEQLKVTPESLGWKGSGLSALPADWAEPKPIPSGLLPVERFDSAMVPEAVAPWIMDVAERMQCPPDFVAVAMMVGLGSVLGRKIAVRPQRYTDWFEVPNLWGCIVGRPGAKKSPAMSEALRPVERLEAEARKSNAEAQILHEHAIAEHKIKQEAATKVARDAAKNNSQVSGPLIFEKPEAPKIKRYRCNDTTYEALGVILADNPNGVMVFRDELVSLLKTLDREDNAAARGFYLTAWSGVSGYTFDRIMRGVTHIDAACLSLLGSTQPGKLAAYVGRALGGGEGDDGMMQRFSLLVWPDDDAPFVEVDRYPDSAAKEAAFNAVVRLDALTPEQVGSERGEFDTLPFLRLDEGAGTAFASWHADLEGRLRSGDLHAAMASHLSKFKKLVPALALINHLADGGTGAVTEAAMRRALRFAAYLESHALRAYGSGRQAEVAAAKAILSRIRRGDLPAEFTARDVLRHEWSNLSDPDQVKGGLDMLDDLGWVRSRRQDTGGRPKMLFTPHPRAAQRSDAGGD